MDLHYATNIVKSLKKKFKNFTVVGSVKRKEETIHDIDLLLKRKYLDKFLETTSNIIIVNKLNKNIIKVYTVKNNIKIDIFLCDDDNYLFLKFMLESPKKYNIRIRHLAKIKGYKLSQYGLFKIQTNGSYKKIQVKNKTELVNILGITNRTIYDRN